MRRQSEDRRGIILVLAAACLILILAFAAFTVDVGYILVTKTELQHATDAAVLAATQELLENPDGGRAGVIAAAQAVLDASTVAQGAVALVADEDLLIGSWDDATHQFVAVEGDDISNATAVSLTLRMIDDRSNALPLFFAPILGHGQADLQTSAISAIQHDTPRDVMLVIDCSGSMSHFNRMEFTRQGALLLSDQLVSEDRLGLTVYSYPLVIEDPDSGGDDDDDDDDDDGGDDDD